MALRGQTQLASKITAKELNANEIRTEWELNKEYTKFDDRAR